MFPMTPLSSWSLILLLAMLVVFLVQIAMDLEARALTRFARDDDEPAAAAGDEIYDWAVQGL